MQNSNLKLHPLTYLGGGNIQLAKGRVVEKGELGFATSSSSRSQDLALLSMDMIVLATRYNNDHGLSLMALCLALVVLICDPGSGPRA